MRLIHCKYILQCRKYEFSTYLAMLTKWVKIPIYANLEENYRYDMRQFSKSTFDMFKCNDCVLDNFTQCYLKFFFFNNPNFATLML